MQPSYRDLAFLLSLGSLPFACVKDKDDSDSNASTDDTTGDARTGTDSIDSTPTTEPLTAGDSDASSTGTTSDTSDTTGQVATRGTEAQTSFLTSNTDTGLDTEGDTGLDAEGDTGVCRRPLTQSASPTPCTSSSVYRDMRGIQEYLAQSCEQFKSDGLRADGQACVDAMEAAFVCLLQLDCAELVGESPL